MIGELPVNKTVCGNAFEVLKGFPDASVDCIITSPPYWQLRNYGTEPVDWKDGSVCELGLEPTIKLYIDHLIMIFAECKRVLKKEGTMWVNLGDSYNSKSGGMKDGNFGPKATAGQKNQVLEQAVEKSLKPKSLCNIPSRFRIAMTDELGLIQRNNIIWYKPNAMPSSATDRFTVDFEDIMFFVKQGKYYFEQQREGSNVYKTTAKVNGKRFGNDSVIGGKAVRKDRVIETIGANLRTVWEVCTVPSSDKHYAMYPEKLIVRMIEAGCPKEICNECGKAREKITVSESRSNKEKSNADCKTNNDTTGKINRNNFSGDLRDKTTVYSNCNCNAGFHPGIVLDPFSGAGTTGITARKLGRNYINIELHPNNVKITEDRIERKLGTLFN